LARHRPPAAPIRLNDADETRNNILEVAASEFADKGLDGARIDEIAEKTASSKRIGPAKHSIPHIPFVKFHFMTF